MSSSSRFVASATRLSALALAAATEPGAAEPSPPSPEPPLDAREPGIVLAAHLAELELADVGTAEVVEAVAAWDRVLAWAAAQQAATIAELHRRRELERCERFVADEVACRLACTRRAAEGMVGLALGLVRLPEVGAALARGEIDTRKAHVITGDLVGRPDDVARRASVTVLTEASGITAPQVRARLRRLELEADPDGAERRHERARRDRHVELAPTDDSMAWLTALLPADDAMAVWTSLTALADAAPAGDARGMDARRADALVDLATRWLEAGVCPDGPLPTRHGRRPHLQLTASATAILGLDDCPAELAGYGPVPAPMARRMAARSTWEPLLVDGTTGRLLARGPRVYRPTDALVRHVVDRDVTCRFPGCRMQAARCDLDHVEPFDHGATGDGEVAPGSGADAGVTGGTTPENLQALCRHHHLAKTHGGWSVTRDDPTGTTSWRAPTGHRYVRGAEALDHTEHLPGSTEPVRGSTEHPPDPKEHRPDPEVPPGHASSHVTREGPPPPF